MKKWYCEIGCAVLVFSCSHLLAGEPRLQQRGAQPDSIQATKDVFLENSDVNLLLENPDLAKARILDVNSDGELNDSDLSWWRARAKNPVLDDENRVIAYEYNKRLDVNGDHWTDVLDFVLLKCGIAKELSKEDRVLVFEGRVVSPVLYTGGF